MRATSVIRLAAGVALAGGLLAGAAATGADTRPRESAPEPLYGIEWQRSPGLVRVDPLSLRSLGGRRLPVAGEPLGWSFAPDGSRLALGDVAPGSRLRFFDLRAMRALGDVRVARRGSGVFSAWAGPRTVLAVVVTPGCCGAGNTMVAAVDTTRRRVLWRRPLGGSLQAATRFRGRLVLILGPQGRALGSSRLVRVGGDGRIRAAALPEIRSGLRPSGRFMTESWSPGLGLDPTGGRAFVVQTGAPVMEVDLSTLEVRARSLEPSVRAADAVHGPDRDALWLGRGMLAVTGSDQRRSGREAPAGLTLIDTRHWSARRIDRRATDVALVSGTLLAFSDARPGGLTGYALDGRRKFRFESRGPIWGVLPLGGRALIAGRRDLALIDPRRGRELRRVRLLRLALLAGDQPYFD